MTTPVREPPFTREMFAEANEECDVVMKGGVTSGVVYPYAVLELATRYRFRSVGGTSAGGIAAAFAAAAEFARQRGDPAGFSRLEARCLELPERLATLFQPEPSLRALMRIAQQASAGDLIAGICAAVGTLWATAGLGAVAGGLLLRLLGGGAAGIGLGVLVGIAAAVTWRLYRLVTTKLPSHGFGLCSGLTVAGSSNPALTDWIHAALQEIAFGEGWRERPPLTFGDLRNAGGDVTLGRSIDLRMMTTNLSMKRPHVLPALPNGILFEEAAWARLFPAEVMTYLRRDAIAARSKLWAGHRLAPKPDLFPLIVAVRMSLSFPFLISAVPMAIPDIGAEKRTAARLKTPGRTPQASAKAKKILAPLWFTDGGLSSNFPIHFFDAPLPGRPTFALSLDDLPSDMSADDPRVSLPTGADEGLFLPLVEIHSLGGFVGALLNAAKDWQDQLLSVMPGQRERIVRVALDSTEGGLNLTMTTEVSRRLMGYGLKAGEALLTQFDFDEHRWRRGLAAYQQLEGFVEGHTAVWNGGYRRWFVGYKTKARSYRTSTVAERDQIQAGLGAVPRLASDFQPKLTDRPRRFPRPYARLRGVPDV